MSDKPKCLSPQHHRAECECGLGHPAFFREQDSRQNLLNQVAALQTLNLKLEAERERLREALTWATGFIQCNLPHTSAEYPDMRNVESLVASQPLDTGEFQLAMALKPFAWCGEKVIPAADDDTQTQLCFSHWTGLPNAGCWRKALAAYSAWLKRTGGKS